MQVQHSDQGQKKNLKKNSGKLKKKRTQELSAKAKGSKGSNKRVDIMMLDSGTIAHMTPRADLVDVTRSSIVSIRLADDSTVNSDKSGTRNVQWFSKTGPVKVKLSNTLIAPRMSMSLYQCLLLSGKTFAYCSCPERHC